MTPDSKRFAQATLTLIGTIIGVGIFGVPFALSQSGALVGLAFFGLLGGIQLLQHLFYAEAAIATKEPLRLVGLVGRYVGPRARQVAAVSLICGFWGGMLAYMIVGGTFLHALLSPTLGGGVFVYQLAWALLGAAAVYYGLEFITRLDVAATIALLGTLIYILLAGAPHVDLSNLTFDIGPDVFLPYGVILFSLSGLPAILEMEDILKGRHRSYRLAVTLGTLAATAFTAAFGFMVWGVAGTATSPDAASGLVDVLGPVAAVIIPLFGFLAVATSFFATAINLQTTFENDYRLPHRLAWFLTGAVPLGILLAGAKEFVPIVSFTGAVFGGVTAVLVALLYVAIVQGGHMKEKRLGAPLWLAYASMTILAVGAAYETWVTAGHLL